MKNSLTERERIMKLLQPLFTDHDRELIPASENSLADFYRQMSKRNISSHVIEQLTEFYKVSNGVPCLDGFDFHNCNDEILFEWWESNKELWLGHRDDDVLRWTNNKYCLGDACDVSYSEKYEFPTLIGLLENAFEEWQLNMYE